MLSALLNLAKIIFPELTTPQKREPGLVEELPVPPSTAQHRPRGTGSGRRPPAPPAPRGPNGGGALVNQRERDGVPLPVNPGSFGVKCGFRTAPGRRKGGGAGGWGGQRGSQELQRDPGRTPSRRPRPAVTPHPRGDARQRRRVGDRHSPGQPCPNAREAARKSREDGGGVTVNSSRSWRGWVEGADTGSGRGSRSHSDSGSGSRSQAAATAASFIFAAAAATCQRERRKKRRASLAGLGRNSRAAWSPSSPPPPPPPSPSPSGPDGEGREGGGRLGKRQEVEGNTL
ncbi:collagen alpha-1(III) chain-like [Sarcophilus harrisii]|uniref:collagen alpha-1(III) chain-like n=1 Tax=Sarcophilus harrisii TaxID=9305 RepID=UPI0013019D71|nr:collagen alpha-1(III) chain-like [Sarcophilus harrisii]